MRIFCSCLLAISSLLAACVSTPPKTAQELYPFPAFDPQSVSPSPKIQTGCEPPRPDSTSMRQLRPDFPVASARRGVAGYAIFDFRINISGHVEDVELVASNPVGEFEKHSLKWLEKLVFSIDTRNNACINQKYRVAYPYHFMTECIPNLFPADVTTICVTGYIQRF